MNNGLTEENYKKPRQIKFGNLNSVRYVLLKQEVD